MMEAERRQQFDIRRVYLFMEIDADGSVDVGLFHQDWFDGDNWMSDLDDDELDKLLDRSPSPLSAKNGAIRRERQKSIFNITLNSARDAKSAGWRF